MTPKRQRVIFFLVIALGAYPACLLAFVWYHVLTTQLPGGRHGPLDAYRHTLASAFVSFTVGSWTVDCVSAVMESGDLRSNAMDRQNNSIGASIGLEAVHFEDLEPLVAAQVNAGAENATNADQTTWLPEIDWQDGKLW